MKHKIKNILIFFQVVSFIPFFFGSFVFFFEFYDDFRIISHLNQYKAGIFIVTEEIDDSKGEAGGAISIDSVVIGTIANKKARIPIGSIRDYTNFVKKGDILYVWYRNDLHVTLLRKKEDNSFKFFKYIHNDFRGLMILGIPPFIILTIVLRRMKKKTAKQNITI